MVERLKAAIEKAREQRSERDSSTPPAPSSAHAASPSVEEAWSALDEIALDAPTLHRNRIITYDRADPAHAVFDMLRTRLVKVCAANKWRRVAITSPRAGVGKSVMSANLAFALARVPEKRTALIDLDTRRPTLASLLGQRGPFDFSAVVESRISWRDHMLRHGGRLALSLNSNPVSGTEFVQRPETSAVLAAAERELAIDISIYDMPPVLAGDEALAFMGQVDCVLLIAAAGATKARDISDCERLLGDEAKILGVVLNKAVDETSNAYWYDYDT